MIQFSNKSNSIVQLKQFNSSIEKKNIHLHIVEAQNMICKKLYIYKLNSF